MSQKLSKPLLVLQFCFSWGEQTNNFFFFYLIRTAKARLWFQGTPLYPLFQMLSICSTDGLLELSDEIAV